MTTEREDIVASLLGERTVDIVTTGRHSGRPRITEIWTTCLFGRVFICGTPNAGRTDTDRQPRDWLANLLVDPELILRLKTSIEMDLTATAEPITDPDQRRRILSAPISAYYREAIGIEPAVQHSPIVGLTFTDDAAWIDEAMAAAAS